MNTNTLIIDQIKSIIEDNIPRWLSVRDCVRISGLSESSIRRAIKEKRLRANKKGK